MSNLLISRFRIGSIFIVVTLATGWIQVLYKFSKKPADVEKRSDPLAALEKIKGFKGLSRAGNISEETWEKPQKEERKDIKKRK